MVSVVLATRHKRQPLILVFCWGDHPKFLPATYLSVLAGGHGRNSMFTFPAQAILHRLV